MALTWVILIFTIWLIWKAIRIQRDSEMRAKLESNKPSEREEAESYYLGFWGAAFVTILILIGIVLFKFIWPLLAVVAIIWLLKALILA